MKQQDLGSNTRLGCFPTGVLRSNQPGKVLGEDFFAAKPSPQICTTMEAPANLCQRLQEGFPVGRLRGSPKQICTL